MKRKEIEIFRHFLLQTGFPLAQGAIGGVQKFCHLGGRALEGGEDAVHQFLVIDGIRGVLHLEHDIARSGGFAIRPR